MKKEIFSWAALENCCYDIKKLKEKIVCCRCGTQIDEAGFLGYKKVDISWLDQQFMMSRNRENLLIEHYRLLHTTCDYWVRSEIVNYDLF